MQYRELKTKEEYLSKYEWVSVNNKLCYVEKETKEIVWVVTTSLEIAGAYESNVDCRIFLSSESAKDAVENTIYTKYSYQIHKYNQGVDIYNHVTGKNIGEPNAKSNQV